ncbi:MAG: efflux RND transporter periplasmic adaptor subunit [Acidimicrobiales bacterium]
MNRRMLYRLGIQGGVVVVVFAAGFGTRMYFAKTPIRGAGFTLTSQTITVTDGSAIQTTSASGTIAPKVSDTVNFSTSGTINAVDVTTGETVTAGQTLATLDSANLSAQVAQAQAQLASAQTRLSQDTSAGASSATLASDNSSVTQASIALTNAQSALAGATLTSPIAGTVVSVGLVAGTQSGSGGSNANVNSNAASSSGSGGITIIDPSSWVINASVSDASISKIKVGEQVSIAPQGVSTTSYGTVASVGLVAQVSNNVATFPITIDVTGSPPGYYSGLPATMTITTSVTTNAITVPILAVRGFRTTSPYVERVTSSGDVKTPITLGAQSGATVVVTKGLRVGDKIVELVPSIAGGIIGGSTTRRGFGGGGFGGGGLGGGFGGGFGGGGA